MCSPFLNLAASATFLALHELSFPCHVFLGCRAAAPHNRLGHSLQCLHSVPTGKQWAGQDFLLFRVCLFLHTILCCTVGAKLPVSVMHIPTKANFPLHCSVSLRARNQGTSCFCVELQIYLGVSYLQSHVFETGGDVLYFLARASFDAAKVTRSSAQARTGKYQLSTLKSAIFSFLFLLLA